MSHDYGYKFFKEAGKRAIYNKLSFLSILLLLMQMSFGSLFFIGLPRSTASAENDQLCSTTADVVLVMDRSGSMGYTSACDWWEYKCMNKPTCTILQWVHNFNYNVTASWCSAKNQIAPHESHWIGYDPTKIVAAKTAAKTSTPSKSDPAAQIRKRRCNSTSTCLMRRVFSLLGGA